VASLIVAVGLAGEMKVDIREWMKNRPGYKVIDCGYTHFVMAA
jgi:hypothetical protein